MGDHSYNKYNDEFTDRSTFCYYCSKSRHKQCTGDYTSKKCPNPCTCKCPKNTLGVK